VSLIDMMMMMIELKTRSTTKTINGIEAVELNPVVHGRDSSCEVTLVTHLGST
jgi:hypothetical protein